MIQTDYRCDTLILGIGNLLWADEGFGIRTLERLHADWVFRPGVSLLDGGTQGLYLLPYVEGCRRLLIFDAVDYGLEPGTLKVVRDEEVPRFMGVRKMSLHQTGFQEVLSVAQLRGWQPDNVMLIGCQPETLEDYGGSLSNTVKARIPDAIGLALDTLYGWLAKPQRRTQPTQQITLHSLGLEQYESQRPSAATACRFGDERFLENTQVRTGAA
jgi:hydrogenase maturation protease